MSVSEIVSIRIPRDLKKKMKETEINWSREIRAFIEEKIREHTRIKKLKEIDKMLANISTPKGSAAKYIREDRDGN